MSTLLDQLKSMTVVVADTGDIKSIRKFTPRDATTNPSLITAAAGMPEYADVVDGAMIFGTGFAPFRGGPLQYARGRGAAEIVAALRALSAKFGERFEPDPGWDNFA